MAYGFVFPKKGYARDTAVKNLSWRDDQQVFLARDRQTKTVTINSGTNLSGQYYDLEIDITWDYYVYHAFLSTTWGSDSRTFAVGTAQTVSFGGRTFLVQTRLLQGGTSSQPTAMLRFYFLASGSGSVTSGVTMTFSAYLCLQSITTNSVSGAVADTGATGLKVSLPGYDVRTCTPKQCSLHSEYTALKARQIGSVSLSANTWTQVSHDFGYEPGYWGYFTANSGGLTGVVPLGGGPGWSNNLSEDPRVQSYVTTSSLYLYSTKAATVYYYLFADQAGAALADSQISYDNYGAYGLLITRPGADIRAPKPNQLRFCSSYPNFKVYSELTHSGTSIAGQLQLSRSCGENDTTIYVGDANRFGSRGAVYLARWDTYYNEEWWWTSAYEPAFNIDYNSAINNGARIIIHAEGSTFEGSYNNGSFSGSARWTGDKGSRRFQFDKSGWQTCDTGWSQGYCPAWENKWTWYRGESEYVEVYTATDMPACWYMKSKSEYTEYHQEKVSFTNSSSTQLTGCTRGIDGTTKRSWASDTYIIPETMVFRIGGNPFSYNPAFMAWTIGPYEADGARLLPTGTGSENLSVVLAGGSFYYTIKRGFAGENDSWFSTALPHVWPGVYLKTFYDEIGT